MNEKEVQELNEQTRIRLMAQPLNPFVKMVVTAIESSAKRSGSMIELNSKSHSSAESALG